MRYEERVKNKDDNMHKIEAQHNRMYLKKNSEL